MRRFYYLGTLVFVFGIPTIVAGFYLSNFISLSALVPFVLFVTLMGSILDIWATRHGKKDRVWLWDFNRKDNLGFYTFGLPCEEYLFYTISSVYVIFMWEIIKLIMAKNMTEAYVIVLLLSGWTLVSVMFLYLFAPKGDRL